MAIRTRAMRACVLATLTPWALVPTLASAAPAAQPPTAATPTPDAAKAATPTVPEGPAPAAEAPAEPAPAPIVTEPPAEPPPKPGWESGGVEPAPPENKPAKPAAQPPPPEPSLPVRDVEADRQVKRGTKVMIIGGSVMAISGGVLIPIAMIWGAAAGQPPDPNDDKYDGDIDRYRRDDKNYRQRLRGLAGLVGFSGLLTIGGAISFAIGGIIYGVGKKKQKAANQASLRPGVMAGPGSAGLSFTGRF